MNDLDMHREVAGAAHLADVHGIQWLEAFEPFIGRPLPYLRGTAEAAAGVRTKILTELDQRKLDVRDASFVVYGSLARDEWTNKSDADWTLLLDGPVDPAHVHIARQIADMLRDLEVNEPGREGVFGNITVSHDLVYRIGGQRDTNANLTRRVLLLLESKPIGDAQAYNRVIRAVLRRYCEEDAHFPGGASEDTRYRVPRFLLNDVVRFWRTMAVDYASKRYERANEGWALRATKLRMSRKLIFASGFWMCLSCPLGPAPCGEPGLFPGVPSYLPLVNHLSAVTRMTPLELLASGLREHGTAPTANLMFNSYERFLQLLNDNVKRARLAELSVESGGSDAVWQEARDLAEQFERGLEQFFFEDSADVARLARRYGVF